MKKLGFLGVLLSTALLIAGCQKPVEKPKVPDAGASTTTGDDKKEGGDAATDKKEGNADAATSTEAK